MKKTICEMTEIERILNRMADEEETIAEECCSIDLNAAYYYHKGRSEAFRIAAIRINKVLSMTMA